MIQSGIPVEDVDRVTMKNESLPVAVEIVKLFCAWNLRGGLGASSISNYLCSIFSWLASCNSHKELRQCSSLKTFLRAIKVHEGKPPERRYALTVKFLLEFKKDLDLDNEEDANIWAATVMAFFGLLRASEYTVTSSRDEPSLRDGDIVMSHEQAGDILRTKIKRSKTDPFGFGCQLEMGASKGAICPVKTIKQLRRKFPKAKDAPAFTGKRGRPLTAKTLNHRLQLTAKRLKINSKRIGSHGLRAGAATALASSGKFEDWEIQGAGRWASDVYLRYIRSCLNHNRSSIELGKDSSDHLIYDAEYHFDQAAAGKKELLAAIKRVGKK